MDYFGEQVDLKALLEMLKADDDPICVHQHIINLQQQLSIAEEKKLSDFPINGYITRLIEILGHTIMMDFQVDTKCKNVSTNPHYVLLRTHAPHLHFQSILVGLTKFLFSCSLHHDKLLFSYGYLSKHNRADGRSRPSHNNKQCYHREHAVH